MKIKEITKPLIAESEVTLKPMPGAQAVEVDGKAIGTANTPAAATAISDLAKKGEFTAADPTSQPTSETHEEGDLVAAGNDDIGGDGTDAFINDVRDAEFEQGQGRGPEQSTEEGIFGLGNKSPEEWAQLSPQMAQLLQLRAKYQGTQYQQQIEQRINLLKDRLDLDMGEPAGPNGEPKAVVPPEKFDPKQLKESTELSAIKQLAGL